MKRDVGMAFQKITQTRNGGSHGPKSEDKYTSSVPTFLWMDTALYIYLHFYILPSLR